MLILSNIVYSAAPAHQLNEWIKNLSVIDLKNTIKNSALEISNIELEIKNCEEKATLLKQEIAAFDDLIQKKLVVIKGIKNYIIELHLNDKMDSIIKTNLIYHKERELDLIQTEYNTSMTSRKTSTDLSNSTTLKKTELLNKKAPLLKNIIACNNELNKKFEKFQRKENNQTLSPILVDCFYGFLTELIR